MNVSRPPQAAPSRQVDETVTRDAGMTGEATPRSRRAWFTAAVMLAAVAAVYLVQEHWAHLAGNWIYLLLLACPLMHLFMHGGHGSHGGHGARHTHDATIADRQRADAPDPKN